ncbi:MAG: ADP-ribosylation factor-like protein [Candidatus Heimdallarchaeaceae archaeon]
MSSYLSLIRDKLMSEKERKVPQVVVLGLEGSGKSSVVSRLLYGTVSDAHPPQLTCFINVTYGKSVITVIEVDEETARESPYFQDILSTIDGVVFVIDSRSIRHVESSFEYIFSLLDKIPQKTSILFLANKTDMEDSVPFPELLQNPAFSVIMEDINRSVSIYPVSVKTGENFYTAFDWIISRMTGRTPLREEVHTKRIIILQEGGVPAFDHTFDKSIEEHDSTLLGGLISALNIMASTIFESESVMDIVKLGGVKMVIRKMGGWSIVLFVGRDDSESKAQSLAEEILNAFIEEKERDPTREMPKQVKYEILSKIPEIAILLDQQIVDEDEI